MSPRLQACVETLALFSLGAILSSLTFLGLLGVNPEPPPTWRDSPVAHRQAQ